MAKKISAVELLQIVQSGGKVERNDGGHDEHMHEGFEMLAKAIEGLAAAQEAAALAQNEVIMALQKAVNRPYIIKGQQQLRSDNVQIESILTRIEAAVGAKDSKDNPVYEFTFETDPRGVAQRVIATPHPAPARPGPYT